ncbi:MAG: FAD:protein FMN transferase [Acidimicrobiales bacterium]|nr:FAD:protein FMN transferase [Acidimicrobiales bacterium]
MNHQATFSSTKEASKPAYGSFKAIGTSVEVLLTETSSAQYAIELVREQIEELDETASRFRYDSELMKLCSINASPSIVSPLLYELLTVAIRGCEITGGALDPTVGRALIQSGYDRDFSLIRDLNNQCHPNHPSANSGKSGKRIGNFLNSDRSRTSSENLVPGIAALTLSSRANLVYLTPGTLLDLGATAKAYAADRASKAIVDRFGGGALVSIGGDISISGETPPGGFIVGVAERSGDVKGADESLAMTSGGLATSGTLARRWDTAQGEAHHIIDPSTGKPALSPYRTVSVLAGNCTDANIASTAALIFGDKAQSWLQESGLSARLVDNFGQVTYVNDWSR